MPTLPGDYVNYVAMKNNEKLTVSPRQAFPLHLIQYICCCNLTCKDRVLTFKLFSSGTNNKRKCLNFLWLTLIKGHFKIMILGGMHFNMGVNVQMEGGNNDLLWGERIFLLGTCVLQMAAKAAPLITTAASHSLSWEGKKSGKNNIPLEFLGAHGCAQGTLGGCTPAQCWHESPGCCQKFSWGKRYLWRSGWGFQCIYSSRHPAVCRWFEFRCSRAASLPALQGPLVEFHLAHGHQQHLLRNSPGRLIVPLEAYCWEYHPLRRSAFSLCALSALSLTMEKGVPPKLVPLSRLISSLLSIWSDSSLLPANFLYFPRLILCSWYLLHLNPLFSILYQSSMALFKCNRWLSENATVGYREGFLPILNFSD